MTLTWSVYIDFDHGGGWTYDFSQVYDDITAYVKNWRISLGTKEEDKLVASTGSAALVLDNRDKRFSPDYMDGAYYGKWNTRLPLKITVSDGTDTWTQFLGFIRSVVPEGGLSGTILRQEAVLEADDLVTILQGAIVNLPLFEQTTGDEPVLAAINAALNAPLATADIQFTGNPANNDTLTIDGTTITFKTSLSGANNEVKIGATAAATAANLAALLNQDFGANTTYTGGDPILTVTAAVV